MERTYEIAKYRVSLKRKLRIKGLDSSYINNLETWQLEELSDKFD